MEMICPRFNFQRHCELTSYNLKLENSFSQSLPLLKKLLWLFMVTAIRFTCEVKIQTNDLSYQIFHCSLCTSYQHEYINIRKSLITVNKITSVPVDWNISSDVTVHGSLYCLLEKLIIQRLGAQQKAFTSMLQC